MFGQPQQKPSLFTFPNTTNPFGTPATTTTPFGTPATTNPFGTPTQQQQTPTPFTFNQPQQAPAATPFNFGTTTFTQQQQQPQQQQQQHPQPQFSFPNNNNNNNNIFNPSFQQPQPVFQNAQQMLELFLYLQQQQLTALSQQIGAVIQTLGHGIGRGISDGIAQGFSLTQLNQQFSNSSGNLLMRYPDGTPIPLSVPAALPVGRGSSLAEDYLNLQRKENHDLTSPLQYPLARKRASTCLSFHHPYDNCHYKRYINRPLPLNLRESFTPLYPEYWRNDSLRWKKGFSGYGYKTSSHQIPDESSEETWQDREWTRLNSHLEDRHRSRLKAKEDHFKLRGNQISFFDPYDLKYPLKFGSACRNTGPPLKTHMDYDDVDFYDSLWRIDEKMKRRQETVATLPGKMPTTMTTPNERKTHVFAYKYIDDSTLRPSSRDPKSESNSQSTTTRESAKTLHISKVILPGRKGDDRVDVEFEQKFEKTSPVFFSNTRIPRSQEKATSTADSECLAAKIFKKTFPKKPAPETPAGPTDQSNVSIRMQKPPRIRQIINIEESDTEIESARSNGSGGASAAPVPAVHLKCGVKLTRPQYYCCPALADLDKWFNTSNGDCYVPDFMVGHQDYGRVFFEGSTNITGLNLDKIIEFYERTLVLYGNSADRPPYGEGLNRPCTVTLYNIPADKFDSAKLAKICKEFSGTFLAFDERNGRWTFRIQERAPRQESQ